MSVVSEAPKLAAFVRRDFRITLSYRIGALAGLFGIIAQVVALSFLGKLVDASRMPAFDGTRATYVEFVVIGLCLNMTVLLLLHELSRALRNEQLTGTLESLLVTPTRLGTLQLGSTLFNLMYVPLRLGLFLAVIAIVFGLDLHVDGILPAALLTVEFLPFLWGVGLIAAGAVLRFRRGAGAIGTGVAIVGLGSGAFFPLSVLPIWLAHLDAYNPLAIVLNGLRDALIGGAGWQALATPILELLPLAALSLAAGILLFRFFLRREQRLGTLGLY
ncbi:MAG: ABC transporter permease [Solirubrobacteraceae bacterium]